MIDQRLLRQMQRQMGVCWDESLGDIGTINRKVRTQARSILDVLREWG